MILSRLPLEHSANAFLKTSRVYAISVPSDFPNELFSNNLLCTALHNYRGIYISVYPHISTILHVSVHARTETCTYSSLICLVHCT